MDDPDSGYKTADTVIEHMVANGYAITHVRDIPVLRMADIDEVPDQFDRLGVQNIDEQHLATEEMKVKIWHVPPGERLGPHGHRRQEEVYYVLEGIFQVSIGQPGETDTYEAEPGTVFAVSPEMVRGYENIGDEPGRVLVVAAPNVDEGGIPEHEMVT